MSFLALPERLPHSLSHSTTNRAIHDTLLSRYYAAGTLSRSMGASPTASSSAASVPAAPAPLAAAPSAAAPSAAAPSAAAPSAAVAPVAVPVRRTASAESQPAAERLFGGAPADAALRRRVEELEEAIRVMDQRQQQSLAINKRVIVGVEELERRVTADEALFDVVRVLRENSERQQAGVPDEAAARLEQLEARMQRSEKAHDELARLVDDHHALMARHINDLELRSKEHLQRALDQHTAEMDSRLTRFRKALQSQQHQPQPQQHQPAQPLRHNQQTPQRTPTRLGRSTVSQAQDPWDTIGLEQNVSDWLHKARPTPPRSAFSGLYGSPATTVSSASVTASERVREAAYF